MSLDIRKLQNLYKSDAVSRAIIDTLNEEGNSSSMSWDLEPEEIYAFATGGGEPVVELDVATLPERATGRRRFPNLDTCVQSFASTKRRKRMDATARPSRSGADRRRLERTVGCSSSPGRAMKA